MEGNHLENGRATKILAFRGLERQPIETAQAGDIIAIAGLTKATVADTLCAPEVNDRAESTAHRSPNPVHDLQRQRQPPGGFVRR